MRIIPLTIIIIIIIITWINKMPVNYSVIMSRFDFKLFLFCFRMHKHSFSLYTSLCDLWTNEKKKRKFYNNQIKLEYFFILIRDWNEGTIPQAKKNWFKLKFSSEEVINMRKKRSLIKWISRRVREQRSEQNKSERKRNRAHHEIG